MGRGNRGPGIAIRRLGGDAEDLVDGVTVRLELLLQVVRDVLLDGGALQMPAPLFSGSAISRLPDFRTCLSLQLGRILLVRQHQVAELQSVILGPGNVRSQ